MPPSTQPLPPPPAAAAVHTPSARRRSSASAAGVISALPAPWTARSPTSAAGVAASEHDVGPRLAEVRELRDAVFALLLAATRGEHGPAGIETRLNAALAAVPLVPQLRDGDVELTAARDAPALDELLARVGASALDVLRDPALSFCDAPSCGQFFLRHRGDQRWCGPACGTRARVARHAAHRR